MKYPKYSISGNLNELPDILVYTAEEALRFAHISGQLENIWLKQFEAGSVKHWYKDGKGEIRNMLSQADTYVSVVSTNNTIRAFAIVTASKIEALPQLTRDEYLDFQKKELSYHGFKAKSAMVSAPGTSMAMK